MSQWKLVDDGCGKQGRKQTRDSLLCTKVKQSPIFYLDTCGRRCLSKSRENDVNFILPLDVTFLFLPTLKTKEKNSSHFFRAPAPISSPACKLRLFPLKKKQGKNLRVSKEKKLFCRSLEGKQFARQCHFFLSCQCLQRRRLLLFGLRQRTNKKRFSKPHL